eukprot:9790784-Alexandrium_andersonii.AAC.1
MVPTKQAGGHAGGAFQGGPGGAEPPREDAMCAAIRNPLIRNPAIRNPANHYRLACISPAVAMWSVLGTSDVRL